MGIDKELFEILKKKKLSDFWSCLDFLKLSSYSEIESIMIAADFFKGNIWDDVIVAKDPALKVSYSVHEFEMRVMSGVPTSDLYLVCNNNGEMRYEGTDKKSVEIYVLTDKANRNYIELYKSYIETKRYEEIELINDHIKCIVIDLTSEVGIDLFKRGKEKI